MKKASLCENCVFFIQHYRIENLKAFKIPYGHCSITNNQAGRKRKFQCSKYTPLDVTSIKNETSYLEETLQDVKIKLSKLDEYISNLKKD